MEKRLGDGKEGMSAEVMAGASKEDIVRVGGSVTELVEEGVGYDAWQMYSTVGVDASPRKVTPGSDVGSGGKLPLNTYPKTM